MVLFAMRIKQPAISAILDTHTGCWLNFSGVLINFLNEKVFGRMQMLLFMISNGLSELKLDLGIR